MNAVWAAHSYISPGGDAGKEEDLYHIHGGGHSVTHVPSVGWGRRISAFMQSGMLSDTCP